MKNLIFILTALIGLSAFAADENSLQALEGRDPVAYVNDGKAVRGDGFILSEYKGQTYLFSSKDNKSEFDKNPEKFVPQFGGWCAFGASVGKKFHADPEAFVVHKGKLYVNVNKDILKKFKEDLDGNIAKAEKNWTNIKNKRASKL